MKKNNFSSIFIGDPHAKLSNLENIEKILKLAVEKKDDSEALVLLGDLTDTHAMIRSEVLAFWGEQIKRLSSEFSKIIIIPGNHDQVGSAQKEHINSLWPLKTIADNITVVGNSFTYKKVGFFPYTASAEILEKRVKDAAVVGDIKTMVVHQTFDGAKYDNGMFAPDGFSLEPYKHLDIISGHIHSQSEFANVWYPGTAIWESASDANKEKGIWKIDFEDGKRAKTVFYSTGDVVPKMALVVVNEGEELPSFSQNTKYVVHLIGTSSWIKKNKKTLENLKHKVKTTYTDSSIKKAERKALKSSNIGHFIENGNYKSDKTKIISFIEGL